MRPYNNKLIIPYSRLKSTILKDYVDNYFLN